MDEGFGLGDFVEIGPLDTADSDEKAPASHRPEDTVESDNETESDDGSDDDGHYDADMCRLFPRKYDFTKVCNCQDCLKQIRELKNSEKDIKSKFKLLMDLLSQLEVADHKCTCISIATWWTELFSDLLYTNLRQALTGTQFVPEPSGFAHRLEDINAQIQSNRRGNEKEMKVEPDIGSVPAEIEYGLLRYGCHGLTKVKDRVHDILKKILVLEDQKKSVEEGERPWVEPWERLAAPTHEQIKLFESMPVEEMLFEFQEQTRIVSCISKISCFVVKAKDDIFYTCLALIKIRKKFWKKYQTKPENGHDFSGLKSTLISLKQEVSSFLERWELEYASFLPRDANEYASSLPRDANECASVSANPKKRKEME